MINDIKLDSVMTSLMPKKTQIDMKQPVNTVAEEGITVTNSMKNLMDCLASEDISPEENLRVLEVKHQIDNHTYQIDLDALSGRLIKDVFANTIGG